ncbi:Kinesin like protein, partial [Aduncisulcus paluster]
LEAELARQVRGRQRQAERYKKLVEVCVSVGGVYESMCKIVEAGEEEREKEVEECQTQKKKEEQSMRAKMEELRIQRERATKTHDKQHQHSHASLRDGDSATDPHGDSSRAMSPTKRRTRGNIYTPPQKHQRQLPPLHPMSSNPTVSSTIPSKEPALPSTYLSSPLFMPSPRDRDLDTRDIMPDHQSHGYKLHHSTSIRASDERSLDLDDSGDPSMPRKSEDYSDRSSVPRPQLNPQRSGAPDRDIFTTSVARVFAQPVSVWESPTSSTQQFTPTQPRRSPSQMAKIMSSIKTHKFPSLPQHLQRDLDKEDDQKIPRSTYLTAYSSLNDNNMYNEF